MSVMASTWSDRRYMIQIFPPSAHYFCTKMFPPSESTTLLALRHTWRPKITRRWRYTNQNFPFLRPSANYTCTKIFPPSILQYPFALRQSVQLTVYTLHPKFSRSLLFSLLLAVTHLSLHGWFKQILLVVVSNILVVMAVVIHYYHSHHKR